MNKKRYFLIAFVVILGLVINGTATAQRESSRDEPRPDREHDRQSVNGREVARDLSFTNAQSASVARTFEAEQSNAPAIALGAPGLNFRIDRTIGVTAEPYLDNTNYLNGPGGLFIDPAGDNIYIVESEGSRILRFGVSGELVIGTSGWWSTADGYLNWPQDVHADSTGDIWVVDGSRVARFSSTGAFEMSFPANPDEREECLSDNLHFCYPQGLAFDSLGRLYISDTENHRIQVFTISGGNLVYWSTIGTGIPGTGNNQFNYPSKLAINSSNELFVADTENHRIQKCTYAVSWSCSTFHGVSGASGDDDSHLAWPWGITVDATGNVFIADEGNWRIKKCTSAGVCSILTNYLNDPTDVAVFPDGTVLVSDWYNSYVVSAFQSNGTFIGDIFGTYGEAYSSDNSHIYTPHGIAVDPTGSLYVSERMGNRWLKINPDGSRIWTKGTPGLRLNDSAHFGDNLYGNPAISASNRLYLPAGSQRCVKVYDLNGAYLGFTIGTCHGSAGDTGTLLGNVAGVAISPLNGNIYVVDRGNSKVKIYNSSHTYLNYLGFGLGSVGLGNGNYQFDQPMGIAVDSTGSIYVADRMNHRVQKYNSSGIFQYTVGVTDWCDWPYGYLCAPSGVAVDSANRLYIAENWNQRVTIYDSTGAYLDTIGGNGGTTIGMLNGPAGVAVAADGTVYVTEQYNHRIQVFKPGVIGWAQSNLDGFGNPYRDWIWALESFGGYLYATPTRVGNSAELWRFSDATGWNQVAGFGTAGTWVSTDLIEFNGSLYATTYSETGAGIWRSGNGTTWNNVYAGNVNVDDYSGFWHLSVFNNTIYATSDYSASHGTRILKSPTGNAGSWVSAAADGFGNPDNLWVESSQVHNGCLYMGTGNDFGAQLWRNCDGTTWDRVDNNSFGDTINADISAMDSFNNKFYVSTWYASDFTGAQLYSCVICDGSDWTQVESNGLGDVHNNGRANLLSNAGWLYWSLYNWNEEGMGVWRTNDGQNWQKIGFDGFGDVNNFGPAGDNASAVYNGRVFIGTHNWADGGEIWALQNLIFLPFAIR